MNLNFNWDLARFVKSVYLRGSYASGAQTGVSRKQTNRHAARVQFDARHCLAFDRLFMLLSSPAFNVPVVVIHSSTADFGQNRCRTCEVQRAKLHFPLHDAGKTAQKPPDLRLFLATKQRFFMPNSYQHRMINGGEQKI